MSQSSKSDQAMRDILFLMPSWASPREEGEVLTTIEQLNRVERTSMFDLAQLENIVNGHTLGGQLTIDDWYRFSGKVFRLWDTRLNTTDNRNPVFDVFLPAEHSVRVGTTTNPSGTLVYAYLSISIDIEPHRLNLSWNDHAGHNIAHGDIKFDYSMEECISLAMFQYDQCVVDRVKRYNERLIIANARRRLVKFSESGSKSEPCVLPWCKQVTLKPLVFTCTSVDQRENLVRKTVERLRGPQELGADQS